MLQKGSVKKLLSSVDLIARDVSYSLPIGGETIPLNQFIGKPISIKYDGIINCINCGRKTNKSFAQGHCFPCMRSLASCDICIVKPELCHFHEGTCREPEWGEANCFVDHYIYLSNTSGLKIGVTRGTQLPTRWIDQGAVAAMPIYRATSRRIAGLIEHSASSLLADKTNWRTMLKGAIKPLDFSVRWNELKPQITTIIENVKAEHGQDIVTEINQKPDIFNYPVINYPEKVVSHNLDKTGEASGMLMGIKGQYLIFDTGVMNVRKYTGYELILSTH